MQSVCTSCCFSYRKGLWCPVKSRTYIPIPLGSVLTLPSTFPWSRALSAFWLQGLLSLSRPFGPDRLWDSGCALRQFLSVLASWVHVILSWTNTVLCQLLHWHPESWPWSVPDPFLSREMGSANDPNLEYFSLEIFLENSDLMFIFMHNDPGLYEWGLQRQLGPNPTHPASPRPHQGESGVALGCWIPAIVVRDHNTFP